MDQRELKGAVLSFKVWWYASKEKWWPPFEVRAGENWITVSELILAEDGKMWIVGRGGSRMNADEVMIRAARDV